MIPLDAYYTKTAGDVNKMGSGAVDRSEKEGVKSSFCHFRPSRQHFGLKKWQNEDLTPSYFLISSPA
jgi:hypothetical protein